MTIRSAFYAWLNKHPALVGLDGGPTGDARICQEAHADGYRCGYDEAKAEASCRLERLERSEERHRRTLAFLRDRADALDQEAAGPAATKGDAYAAKQIRACADAIARMP